MNVVSLTDRRARDRDAAEAVLADVEREILAARDRIMADALRRLAQAAPRWQRTPYLNRVAGLWLSAGPLTQGAGR
jgi:hypothetical protein